MDPTAYPTARSKIVDALRMQGYAACQIAHKLGCDEAVVQEDLDMIDKRWHDYLRSDDRVIVAREVRMVEWGRSAAWEAYLASLSRPGKRGSKGYLRLYRRATKLLIKWLNRKGSVRPASSNAMACSLQEAEFPDVAFCRPEDIQWNGSRWVECWGSDERAGDP